VRQGPLRDLTGGGSLEEAFVAAVGQPLDMGVNLSWLGGQA
jgi:hypothetical protein